MKSAAITCERWRCSSLAFSYYCTNDDLGRNNIATAMEDEIYPLHSLDDTKSNRQFVSWLLRFNDVLNAEVLHDALCRLLGQTTWRKLGGRLKQRVAFPTLSPIRNTIIDATYLRPMRSLKFMYQERTPSSVQPWHTTTSPFPQPT